MDRDVDRQPQHAPQRHLPRQGARGGLHRGGIEEPGRPLGVPRGAAGQGHRRPGDPAQCERLGRHDVRLEQERRPPDRRGLCADAGDERAARRALPAQGPVGDLAADLAGRRIRRFRTRRGTARLRPAEQARRQFRAPGARARAGARKQGWRQPVQDGLRRGVGLPQRPLGFGRERLCRQRPVEHRSAGQPAQPRVRAEDPVAEAGGGQGPDRGVRAPANSRHSQGAAGAAQLVERRADRRLGRGEHPRCDLRGAAPQGDFRDFGHADARQDVRRLELRGEHAARCGLGDARLSHGRADGQRPARPAGAARQPGVPVRGGKGSRRRQSRPYPGDQDLARRATPTRRRSSTSPGRRSASAMRGPARSRRCAIPSTPGPRATATRWARRC